MAEGGFRPAFIYGGSPEHFQSKEYSKEQLEMIANNISERTERFGEAELAGRIKDEIVKCFEDEESKKATEMVVDFSEKVIRGLEQIQDAQDQLLRHQKLEFSSEFGGKKYWKVPGSKGAYPIYNEDDLREEVGDYRRFLNLLPTPPDPRRDSYGSYTFSKEIEPVMAKAAPYCFRILGLDPEKMLAEEKVGDRDEPTPTFPVGIQSQEVMYRPYSRWTNGFASRSLRVTRKLLTEDGNFKREFIQPEKK